jgi:RsiW-degrading membrane proteinase PrsW (M82 family)
MAIRVRCPGCQKTISAPDSFAGKSGRCPACKHVITIPMPAPPDEDDVFDFAEPASPHVPATPAIPAPQWPSPAKVPPPEPSFAGALAAKPAVAVAPREGPASARSAWHPRRYALFALALVPLVFMMFRDENDTDARFESTFDKHPEVSEKVESLLKGRKDRPMSMKDILGLLPDKRIEGAHLACDSFAHWGYGLLSAAFFAGLLWTLFPRGNADPGQTALVALGTATFGVLFLLMLQGIAAFTDGYVLTGGSIIVLIFYIFKFISFSYHAALDPNNGFLLSFFGYTFGVGLCEEFCKAYPLIFRLGFQPALDSRAACFWGLASGVGFGVAEGIMYASSYYNGIATPTIYLVRFTACVALHATWSGSAAIMIWRERAFFASSWEWSDMSLKLLFVLGVPMTLHGLYDTLLKKEMIAFALPAALASFGWLAYLMETTCGLARADESRAASFA